jgi:hypothetical protein
MALQKRRAQARLFYEPKRTTEVRSNFERFGFKGQLTGAVEMLPAVGG